MSGWEESAFRANYPRLSLTLEQLIIVVTFRVVELVSLMKELEWVIVTVNSLSAYLL